MILMLPQRGGAQAIGVPFLCWHLLSTVAAIADADASETNALKFLLETPLEAPCHTRVSPILTAEAIPNFCCTAETAGQTPSTGMFPPSWSTPTVATRLASSLETQQVGWYVLRWQMFCREGLLYMYWSNTRRSQTPISAAATGGGQADDDGAGFDSAVAGAFVVWADPMPSSRRTWWGSPASIFYAILGVDAILSVFIIADSIRSGPMVSRRSIGVLICRHVTSLCAPTGRKKNIGSAI